MPDGVSVRRLDNLGAVVEKQQFQLQCNVTSVAPARLLSVRWYQGNRTLPSQGKGGRRNASIRPTAYTRGSLVPV